MGLVPGELKIRDVNRWLLAAPTPPVPARVGIFLSRAGVGVPIAALCRIPTWEITLRSVDFFFGGKMERAMLLLKWAGKSHCEFFWTFCNVCFPSYVKKDCSIKFSCLDHLFGGDGEMQ